MAEPKRVVTIGGGDCGQRRIYGGRPIPKRGQVKVAILLGLANSLASIFSVATTTRRPQS